MVQKDCASPFASNLLLYSPVSVSACTSAEAVFRRCVCWVALCRQTQRLAGEFRDSYACMPTCTLDF
jgi:hypothetical protein